jgi:tetratricopeptide (TPR) repeat protein
MMMTQFIMLIALATSQMTSRDGALSTALAELEKGHVLESIEQFKQIVRTDPANGPAQFYLSTLYTQMGEYAVAERYLQRAIEINPKQGEYYYQLGLIRYRQKQWRAALESFTRALETGSRNNEAPIWRGIGDAQLELFDRDAALEAYTQALRLQARDGKTRLALGRFYLDRGEPDRAIEPLLVALEADPSLHDAYAVLGRAYNLAGNPSAAVTVLKKELDTDPADQDARYALGRALVAMGRADEGREELDKYANIRQQVGSADSDYKAALSYINDGKFSDAERLLRESLALAPTYGPALHSLGSLLLDRGSPEKALEFLNRAIKVNPLNAATWYSLGSANFKVGKTTEALEAAKRAVVLNDDEVKYRRLVSEIQERLKK